MTIRGHEKTSVINLAKNAAFSCCLTNWDFKNDRACIKLKKSVFKMTNQNYVILLFGSLPSAGYAGNERPLTNIAR
jgi:hypothetical protein